MCSTKGNGLQLGIPMPRTLGNVKTLLKRLYGVETSHGMAGCVSAMFEPKSALFPWLFVIVWAYLSVQEGCGSVAKKIKRPLKVIFNLPLNQFTIL